MPRLARRGEHRAPYPAGAASHREREGCAVPTPKRRKLLTSAQLEQVFRLLGFDTLDLWDRAEQRADEAEEKAVGGAKIIRAMQAREAKLWLARDRGIRKSAESRRRKARPEHEAILSAASALLESGKPFRELSALLALRTGRSPQNIRTIIKPLRPKKKAKVS